MRQARVISSGFLMAADSIQGLRLGDWSSYVRIVP